MKRCPFCAEEIQDAAIKCRFCGSDLPGPGAAADPAPATGHPRNIIFEGSPEWSAWFWSYVLAGILSLAVAGLIWLWILQLRRKATRYRISDQGIDEETGVFSKRVETIQLWRVKHIELDQSIFQRMFGIADLVVTTTDKDESVLVLRGLRNAREIFDRLRDALQITRQRQVVGITQ